MIPFINFLPYLFSLLFWLTLHRKFQAYILSPKQLSEIRAHLSQLVRQGPGRLTWVMCPFLNQTLWPGVWWTLIGQTWSCDHPWSQECNQPFLNLPDPWADAQRKIRALMPKEGEMGKRQVKTTDSSLRNYNLEQWFSISCIYLFPGLTPDN